MAGRLQRNRKRDRLTRRLALERRRRSIAALTARRLKSRQGVSEHQSDYGTWYRDFLSGDSYFSPALHKIVNLPNRAVWSLNDFVRKNIMDEDVDMFLETLNKQVHEKNAFDIEFRIQCEKPDKNFRWIRSRGYADRDKDGNVTLAGGFVEDITEHRKTIRDLEKNEERFRSFVEVAPFPLIITQMSKRRIHYFNPEADRVFGLSKYTPENMPRVPDFFVDQEPYELLRSQLFDVGRAAPTEALMIKPDGTRFWAIISAAYLNFDGESSSAVILHDLTEQKELETKLRMQARTDPLTALTNRAGFTEALQRALKAAERKKDKFSLLLIDLDKFKNVNDTMGHETGDRLLVEAAARLKTILRDTDIVARFDGDEFAVIAYGFDKISGVSVLAQKIIDKLSRPYDLDGKVVNVGVSIGITVYPWQKGSDEELLRFADTALCKAKEYGRGRYFVFDEELTQAVYNQAILQNDLWRSITKNEFCVYYQPRVDSHTHQLVAAEALVRWNHPERGLTPAAAFIPLAEETGFIKKLGEFVLDDLLRQMARWREKKLTLVPVSINFSPSQFMTDSLADEIGHALEKWQIEPRFLQVEMTETALIQDEEQVHSQLEKLSKLGISILIDDFGTGYSSLSYLHKFEVDKLKIDKAFIKNLTDRKKSLLTRQIVEIGRGMGLSVIAEGVETKAQADLLEAMGCDELQGYFYGRPETANSFESRLVPRQEKTRTQNVS